MKKTFIGVISAVLIFWLTQGIYTWWTNRKHPIPLSYSFDGRVIDASTRRLLSNAEVLLDVSGITNKDHTDSEGRYLFMIQRTGHALAALLDVRAQGYNVYTRHIKSDESGVLAGIEDIALQPASPQTPTSPLSATFPRVQVMREVIRVPYQKRSVETAVPVRRLVKGQGPEVFLIENGRRRRIPDMETFKAMGLNWNDVGEISNEDLNNIPRGQDYPSKK